MCRSHLDASVRTVFTISTGPVAQLSPSDAIGKGRNASIAASIEDPTSIVPVCSIVTDTKIGTVPRSSPS